MTVEIYLQTKGAPCWYTNIAKTKIFINEVEIVMKALAPIGFKKRFVSFLIMPVYKFDRIPLPKKYEPSPDGHLLIR